MSRDDANQAARDGEPDPARHLGHDDESVAEQFPDDVDPAGERGERIETGKAIATGGKSAAKGRDDEDEDEHEEEEEDGR